MSRQLSIPGIGGILPGRLIVDLFCCAGGASVGLERALGRSPDIAINHDPEAIRWHEANHPATRHLRTDVRDVDPRQVTQGQAVGWLHASPDCTYHSRAKGAKPLRQVERMIRSLPWIVVRWAALARPDVISMENVPEIAEWGPIRRHRPHRARRGQTWRRFVAALESLGYRVEVRRLSAHHYGAATIRQRLFLVARCDGQAIRWPEATHGGTIPARTAADIIDWSRPCPSIFLARDEAKRLRVKRPLADATLARIAAGVMRCVVNDPKPFIVRLRGTISAGGNHHALVAPFLSKYFSGDRGHRADGPMGTITAWDHHAVVCAQARPVGEDTGRAEAVAAFLMRYHGHGGQWSTCDEPLTTITTKARHGLVVCRLEGRDHVITDIGMRMLDADELAAAQGFPVDYHLPKDQARAIAFIGNSVPPDVMAALASANIQREVVGGVA